MKALFTYPKKYSIGLKNGRLDVDSSSFDGLPSQPADSNDRPNARDGDCDLILCFECRLGFIKKRQWVCCIVVQQPLLLLFVELAQLMLCLPSIRLLSCLVARDPIRDRLWVLAIDDGQFHLRHAKHVVAVEAMQDGVTARMLGRRRAQVYDSHNQCS